MTALVRTQRMIAALGGVVAVVLTLTGCAPQISSPVGTWRAVGEDTGTLTVHEDGTFVMHGASFNPLGYVDAGDFAGVGTWDTYPDDPEVVLRFSQAASDGFRVEPASLSRAFASGAIRFTDPDETVGIEFRIEDSAE
ncbi:MULTISPECIES: hypothetical protein [unclassified Microbacterium]|uniref:hypothetical protein n=1 Tax=unclassified Microbacterium TaxID=2609290 RepID=UPI003466B45B